MPPSVLPAAQLAVTAALVAWMITGFTRLPGRWLRWKMFCRATFTIVSLTGSKDGRTEPVNVYSHLSPGSFLLGPPQLQAVINYLVRSGRYDRMTAAAMSCPAAGQKPLEVTDSRVVL